MMFISVILALTGHTLASGGGDGEGFVRNKSFRPRFLCYHRLEVTPNSPVTIKNRDYPAASTFNNCQYVVKAPSDAAITIMCDVKNLQVDGGPNCW